MQKYYVFFLMIASIMAACSTTGGNDPANPESLTGTSDNASLTTYFMYK